MQKIITLLNFTLVRQRIQSIADAISESMESPEKRQYRILKKFISE
jgi:hypothetical protein